MIALTSATAEVRGPREEGAMPQADAHLVKQLKLQTPKVRVDAYRHVGRRPEEHAPNLFQ